MQQQQQYIGNILFILQDIIQREDGYTVGEKLRVIEQISGKRFFYLTDKEIYEAMEKVMSMSVDNEPDEPLTDSEFNEWVNGK